MHPLPSVVRRKSLYFDCHSGLDPESSLLELDSRLRGNDAFGINVKKRWTHYKSKGVRVSNPFVTPLACSGICGTASLSE